MGVGSTYPFGPTHLPGWTQNQSTSLVISHIDNNCRAAISRKINQGQGELVTGNIKVGLGLRKLKPVAYHLDLGLSSDYSTEQSNSKFKLQIQSIIIKIFNEQRIEGS